VGGTDGMVTRIGVWRHAGERRYHWDVVVDGIRMRSGWAFTKWGARRRAARALHRVTARLAEHDDAPVATWPAPDLPARRSAQRRPAARLHGPPGT